MTYSKGEVCIAQPRSRLRNFGASARPRAQILEILFSVCFTNHSIANTSNSTQQCNVVPYYYAVYWLPSASSAFLFARKCNWLAGIMVIRCVIRRAWTHKFQSSGPTVYFLYCVTNEILEQKRIVKFLG